MAVRLLGVLTMVSLIGLAAGPVLAQQGPPPKMERLVLADGESGAGWNSSEATMEPSAAHARSGRALDFHVKVDYNAGEANYPVGWPRTYLDIPPGEQDWSGWDMLQLWIYSDTSREQLPVTAAGLIVRSADGTNIERSLTELRKGEWTQITVPISSLSDPHHVPSVQNC